MDPYSKKLATPTQDRQLPSNQGASLANQIRATTTALDNVDIIQLKDPKPQASAANVPGERSKSRKRKVIRRIVKKKMDDGTFVPIEITKTVISRDGSRSVMREIPQH